MTTNLQSENVLKQINDNLEIIKININSPISNYAILLTTLQKIQSLILLDKLKNNNPLQNNEENIRLIINEK
jgi:hypothetical protein